MIGRLLDWNEKNNQRLCVTGANVKLFSDPNCSTAFSYQASEVRHNARPGCCRKRERGMSRRLEAGSSRLLLGAGIPLCCGVPLCQDGFGTSTYMHGSVQELRYSWQHSRI